MDCVAYFFRIISVFDFCDGGEVVVVGILGLFGVDGPFTRILIII